MKTKCSEQLLSYIWLNKLFEFDALVTDKGCRIKVIDPGRKNIDSGPDFFNAKIEIDGRLWVGNVEIHRESADWYRHGHDSDEAYNSVILHLVASLGKEIRNSAGFYVPQAALPVSNDIINNADFLITTTVEPPCRDFIPLLPTSLISSFMTNLAIERLERKTNDIYSYLEDCNDSWGEVFYILLTRNFGFGLNSDAFERLARSLPLKIVLKHRDSFFQVEALLFGQAGLLCDDSVNDSYSKSLREEYRFLKYKYNLVMSDNIKMKWLRVRPQSFPSIRLSQLSILLCSSDSLFSSVLEIKTVSGLKKLFRTRVSEYWQTHYSFSNRSPKSEKSVGDASLDLILINSVAPTLFAYGKKVSDEDYCERAFSILEQIKPERNYIVNCFRKAGIIPENALDSQALIQLRKEYCDKKECFFCRIGYEVLSSS